MTMPSSTSCAVAEPLRVALLLAHGPAKAKVWRNRTRDVLVRVHRSTAYTYSRAEESCGIMYLYVAVARGGDDCVQSEFRLSLCAVLLHRTSTDS